MANTRGEAGMTEVTILHNIAEGDRMFRFVPKTSTLRYAHKVVVPSGKVREMLEAAWRAANRVDGSVMEQVPDNRRSMCSGDVAVVNGVPYSCEMVGWKRRSAMTILRALDRSGTDEVASMYL